MPSRCALCSKASAACICSGCKITYYCNVQCQRKHWKQHKKVCKLLAEKQPKQPKPSKSRKSVELHDIINNQQLEQLTEEQELFEKFRKIPELSVFTDKLQTDPDSIAYYLDHPERVQEIIDNPWSMSNQHQTYQTDDNTDMQTYINARELNRNWFKQHTPLHIIQQMRNHFDINSKKSVHCTADIIDNIIKTLYKLQLTTEILNEIEYLSLDDHKINIIEIDAKRFSNDLYDKQLNDIHWVKNNILNKTRHDIKNSFFSKYLTEKHYKNHNNITSIESDDADDFDSDCIITLHDNYNTKLTDNRISCGDIIYVDLNCVDFIDNAIREVFYIIDTDHTTMQRIGMTGHNGIHSGTYIYGKHMVIPSYITCKFYDPIKTYLTFMHISAMWAGGVSNIQIELQISNKCIVFNKNMKHNIFNQLQKNKLLSYYPWPKQNTHMKVKKMHKYKYDLNEMGGGNAPDSNYCTVYIDLDRDKKPVFGYCNNEAIDCINLSSIIESSGYGYIVKYKGDKIKQPLSEKQVDKLLLKLDDKIKVGKVSKCLKKGIANYVITIDKYKGLETMILKDRCSYCDTKIECTIKDALYQADIGAGGYGIDYENSAVDDDDKGCECGNYIIGMCTGNVRLDNGKYYHHCKRCPNMGECIGDHKQGHCTTCNEHYYWGKFGDLDCNKCQHGNEYSDS